MNEAHTTGMTIPDLPIALIVYGALFAVVFVAWLAGTMKRVGYRKGFDRKKVDLIN